MLDLLLRTILTILLFQGIFVVLRRTIFGILIFGTFKILGRMIIDIVNLNRSVYKYAKVLVKKQDREELIKNMGKNKKSDATKKATSENHRENVINLSSKRNAKSN